MSLKLNEIKQKLNQFQSTLMMLEREKNSILEDLKTLGINSLEEAQTYSSQLENIDIKNLSEEILQIENELQDLLNN